MKLSKLEAKIPPLREIPLNTRPLTKRALAWSCDGELAVAADDSVHVFVPSFPDPGETDDDNAAGSDEEADEEEEVDGEDEDNDRNVDLRPAYLLQTRKNVVKRQAQFASGNRQILVSHPRLNPKVNQELFEAAGLPFAYAEGALGTTAGGPATDGESDAESDAEDDPIDEAWADDDSLDGDYTLGAGTGIISSAGSGLNHVVSIAWSPSGLGPNRRPVLAVLASLGYIGFYGDGPSASKSGGDFTSVGRDEGMLKQRDLSSWAILFGAGERFLVPGQQTHANQNIISIAWAKEIGPGQALMAYVNDTQEVALLSIQYISRAADQDIPARRSSPSTGAADEKMVWRVDEVARFQAQGPHPAASPWDPDWVPCGTSFGLRWSPWLVSNDSRTCILSYFDRNYVGFRKITVPNPWIRGTIPNLVVDEADIYGRCIFLSTDGFLEFEDAIWTKGQSKVARGLVVTGFHLEPFEVCISGPQPYSFMPEPHSTADCGTTYINQGVDRPSTNPIVDLIIHPPNMATPSATPTYTLIRLSATSINHDWVQTNASLPDFSSNTGIAEAKPQWALDLAQKLAVLVPADAHMRHTVGGDGDSDAESNTSDKGLGSIDSADELSDGEDEVDIEKAAQRPEVHPMRFRLHGLAAAPGGRATAVLVSAHSTQTPDRIGWWGMRSMLLFGSYKRPRGRNDRGAEDMMMVPSLRQLTTEGRMFNWMYGAGPDVPGITVEVGDGPDSTAVNDAKSRVKAMFKDTIASQKCDLCGEKMSLRSEPDGRLGLSVCGRGHFFSTCGVSGLAIQAPGLSHTCGVCGVQTLKVEELLRKAPPLEERIKEGLTADVCGNCGGKFVD